MTPQSAPYLPKANSRQNLVQTSPSPSAARESRSTKHSGFADPQKAGERREGNEK